MILINKNTNNAVVLTLREKATLANPFYLFELISETTRETIYFVSDNISPTGQSRYDEFIIIESGSTFINLTAGTVNLTPAIFWTYNVFEQATRNNLDPTNTIGLAETGKLYVESNGEQVPTTFYSPTGMTSYITYSNQ